jgi:DNA polymerase III alpha subunit (gram-positive type)
MKFSTICISLSTLVLVNACATGDKNAEVTYTAGGPKVIIDSTGLKSNTVSTGLNTNQPNMPSLVNNNLQSPQTQQQVQTVTASSQNVQMQQQQIQQQIQQQMQQQQAAQPQQVQTVQQSAHPQFSATEFKAMQDDAKKRGVGLNPAHGQAGHRCDIYVGQPLDSKPVAGLSQTTTPPATTTTASTPQTVNVAPQPVQVAAGMNPAHGQPGHRCDIEVGKPLNSKPNPVAEPAKVSTNVSATGSKAVTDSGK